MTDELWTDWINAAADNDVARIAELLAAGVNVNSCDERGQTAFSYACAYNSFETAELLWTNGADINAPHNDGWTPLDSAGTLASPAFRDWLISIGCKHGVLSPEP
jgi:ankyrin repeat protein